MISLAIDLIGSTKAGLEMNEILFRRYNKAIVDQIWPYIKTFDLGTSTLKFTGDGWLLFNPDLQRAQSIVALAKTLAGTFQMEIAKKLQLTAERVPALRLAVCTGEDEQVEFGSGQRDWVGDSARRATRAAGCCAPNQVIVNSTINDKIYRAFATEVVVVRNLPEHQRPKRWEEDFQIFSVGDIRPDFVTQLQYEEDPAASAPYAIYLQSTGRTASAQSVITKLTDVIAANSEGLSANTAQTPAQIAQLADVAAKMRALLFSAPTTEVREDVVSRMTKLGVPPNLGVYNSLISRSASYADALDWLDRMIRHGLRPDGVIYTTLINCSPDYKTARRWFDEMQNVGVQPTIFAFNSLINLAPDYAVAKEFLDLMRSARLQPDVFTYSILIKQSPNYETAVSWLDAMQKAGVAPSDVTYNTLIHLSPDYATAKKWFVTMQDAHARPSVFTYSTLIKAAPDYETAMSWFSAMRAAGVQPNEVTFNTLIDIAPDYATAKAWFNTMREAGLQPNESATSALVKKTNNPEEGDALTAELVAAGIGAADNYYSAYYSRLIEFWNAEQLLDYHARQKYRRPQALEVAIRTFAAQRRVEEAYRIALAFPYLKAARKLFHMRTSSAIAYYEKLLRDNFEPHNCYYALGFCYLEAGNHELALEMFSRALPLSSHEKRTKEIQTRISELRRAIAEK